MQNPFNLLSIPKVGKSKFDLSHEKKLTGQMGNLIPIMLQEIVPGDKFRVQSQIFLRVQSLLSPMMHRVNVTTHYFFVPNRLIWSEFEDFITGGRVGITSPTAPMISIDNTTKSRTSAGTLCDYLGVPDVSSLALTASFQFSALPFRAYQLVYDEYYRDNQITTPIACPKTSGVQSGTLVLDQHLNMRKRAWEKDYFTTARASTQLGTESNLKATNTITYKSQSLVSTVSGVPATANTSLGSSSTGLLVNRTTTTGTDGNAGRIENIDSINTEITINNLRRTIKIQEWLEKNMRSGSRYVEQILSHFGVRSSDARLQRPQYLGGGKQPLNISEVLQTAQSATNAVGSMYGHGYSVGGSNSFSKEFEEHGFVIGIMSVLPKTAYQQGLSKTFKRSDKFDYYWPEFANLGEQEVKNYEVYADPTNPTFESTFGYQQRYAEYKYQPDTVHGDFKSSLNYWHMGRIFSAQPSLNTNFIEADPTQRVFAITDANVAKLLVQVYNKVDAVRPMPYFSIPSI